MEATKEAPFEMTDSAAKQLQYLKDKDKKPKAHLRIKVIGGGCSGLSYDLSFDDSVGEKDVTFEQNGVPVVIDTKSVLFIKGTVLDFSDGLNGQGFVFNNPNAKTTCGCGSSFSA